MAWCILSKTMKHSIQIALVAIILCGIRLSAEQATSPRVPTDKGGTKSHSAPPQVKADNADPSQHAARSGAPPVINQLESHEKKADTEQLKEDIELQRKLVRATDWLVGVGVLQAVILVVQAVAFFWTLRTIKRQADLMEEAGEDTPGCAQQAIMQTELTQAQLELSHRPWVSADIAIASNLIFDQRGALLMFNVTMSNLGSSVAKHVSLWTEFVVSGVHDLNQAHERLCNIMKQPVNEKSDYGSLLFPGQVVVEPRPVIANQQDIDQALKSGHFKDVGAVGLHLIGCVDYQSSFDPKKHHQTKFVLLVGRIDRQRGTVMGTFEPQNKSYDGIVVTPTMHGASAD